MTTTSLSKLPGFVSDAALATATPTADFNPAQVSFGSFGFTAYARSGLSAKVAGHENGRPFVLAQLTISAEAGTPKVVTKKVALYGPRDVIGIDPGQIVRREPSPGALVNYGGTLAHIEFDKPELPWAFSPGVPEGGRLRPWIALVVLEYGSAVSLQLGQGELPPVLTCPARALPSLTDSWAWAHAQVMGGPDQLADKLTDAYGPQNLSRLICPRKLEDKKTYLACVVPTFAGGRDAGLGKAAPTNAEEGLGDAWPSGVEATVQLPVYDHWVFSTDATCDFEELARRLKPVVAPAGVGRRKVDVSNPRGPLTDDQSAIQTLDCALHSHLKSDGDGVKWSAARVQQLREAVDAGSSYTPADTLPRVAPRLYAQFQRGQPKIPAGSPDADWFAGLNLDPLSRIAAGLGTRVVRKDQEPLMRNAWAQVGEIEAANRALAAIQFGRFVGEAMMSRTLAKAQLSSLTQMTAAAHGKIVVNGNKTVAGDIDSSVLPRSAASAAFRKMMAPGGKAAQASLRIAGATAPSAPFAKVLGGNKLADLRRVYREPDGIASVSAVTIASLPNGPLRARLPVGGTMITPMVERIAAGKAMPKASVDVVAEGARRRESVLRSWAQNARLTAGQRESLGGILANIATTAPADLARDIDATLAKFDREVPVAKPVIRGTLAVPSSTKTMPDPVLSSKLVGRGGLINPGGTISSVTLSPGAGAGAATSSTTSAGTPSTSVVARQRFLQFGGGPAALPLPQAGRIVTPTRIAQVMQTLVTGAGLAGLGGTADRPAAKTDRSVLLAGLDPVRNATRYAKARVTIPDKLGDWFKDLLVRPIMAAPKIERPMYEALLDYDRDWLVPGLNEIAQTDFVTVLLSNDCFIEAYMAGLSDEMGRELLWRGYPTDQRGTYFRRFWSSEHDELADDIHRWKRTRLGDHYTAGTSNKDGAEKVVLMIKGALIRKIPHALVVACRGKGKPKSVEFDPPSAGEGSVLFRAPLDADTLLVGFDLTADAIAKLKKKGDVDKTDERWWFLIAEHPTAPRFGLDIPPSERQWTVPILGRDVAAARDRDIAVPPRPNVEATHRSFPTKADDLQWGDLPMSNGHLLANASGSNVAGQTALGWGTDAARMTAMLLQRPVRAAFDADELLGKVRQTGNGVRPIIDPGHVFQPAGPIIAPRID